MFLQLSGGAAAAPPCLTYFAAKIIPCCVDVRGNYQTWVTQACSHKACVQAEGHFWASAESCTLSRPRRASCPTLLGFEESVVSPARWCAAPSLASERKERKL